MPMASCFQQQRSTTRELDDSIMLFSTSDSNEGESASSSSSSSRHQSPQQTQPAPNHHAEHYKLTVTNLSYTIHQNPPMLFPFSLCPTLQHKPKQIKILKSVSFTAWTSELLAVVGPSGTGKSTLIRIISGRVRNTDFSPHSISLNDQTISSPAQLRMLCGYVAQEDDLLPLLTVKETLVYSAKFRLRHMSPKAKEERVQSLLLDLGLIHIADSFIGDEDNRGISGGERKRVSIGVEMIHDPPVLLLDEPTSGLDSASALQVIELLSSMAKSKHRTIVFSIHQPSFRILTYISRFLILCHGAVVHNGSLESLEERISHLGYEIPVQLNALEFAMEIITKLEDDQSQNNQGLLWHNEEEIRSRIESNKDYYKQAKNADCQNLMEIIYLCSRFWKVIYRTKQLFLARTLQALVGGFGLGSVYVKIGREESEVAERLGLFAFSLSFLLSSTVEALPIYLRERRVLMKEVSRGAYKTSSYMIANTIVFLPFLLVVALLFSAPVYWIVGLNTSIAAFSYFVFVVWLIVLMASSLVLFLSAVSPDFITGNSLICMVLGAFFLFSGYFIPKESIPKYWKFMYYVSLYRYPLDSMLVNEYWSKKDKCFAWAETKCLLTGYDVLRGRGLDKDTRWINVGIMLGFFFLYRVICWVVLARKAVV